MREERDCHVEELARMRTHLQEFIIRNDPGLRFVGHEDRDQTIAVYHREIAYQREELARCERFLEAYA